MKYGKINRLKEDIGTAFDVLMYGSPIYQHGVKAGQWGRAAANVAGTYAGLKTEEKALGGNPAGRIGRKFGLALAKSKYPRGTFNQRESMSAVWRATLCEGTLRRDFTKSTPEDLGLVSDLLGPEFKQGARQQGMGEQAVYDARKQIKRVGQAQDTITQRAAQAQKLRDIRKARGGLRQSGLDDAADKAHLDAKAQRKAFKGTSAQGRTARSTVAVYGKPQKMAELQATAGTGLDPEAMKAHASKIGKQRMDKLGELKKRTNDIRVLAKNRAKTVNNVAKPDALYWDSKKPGLKGLGLMGAAAGLGAVRAIGNAARSVSSASSTGYADLMRNASVMPQLASAGGKRGNLQEGSKTWETRRRLYGPPGRKHKHWKFDFNNPEHVKKALHLKGDSDIKKLMKSTAKIDKHVGLKTTKGVPIQYAYRSNNRKNLYAGKTIGMRQNIISQHRKLGLDLPEGFENLSFDKINEIFKKRERHGWYKRQYKKVPTFRKLMIGAGAMWRKAKKALGFNESEILEEATFVESAPPAPRVCVFMEGKVATPTECDCDECLSVTRRMREGKLEETAASSFGQMLRPTETPPPKLETGTPVQVSKKHMIAANSRWRRLRKQVSTV